MMTMAHTLATSVFSTLVEFKLFDLQQKAKKSFFLVTKGDQFYRCPTVLEDSDTSTVKVGKEEMYQ